MNIEKVVNQKLFSKTKQKLEKVDLALVDDIKTMQNQAMRLAQNARDIAKDAEKEFQKAKSETQKANEKVENIRKQAFNAIIDAREKAKEIGIELPRELYDRYDEIEEAGRKIPITNLANVFPI